jgi:hypothetical protein
LNAEMYDNWFCESPLQPPSAPQGHCHSER